MTGKGSNRSSRWTVTLGAIFALVAAVFMLGLVINSYLTRDAFPMRALILSLFLLGTAAIIWTEGRHYTPPHHLSR